MKLSFSGLPRGSALFTAASLVYLGIMQWLTGLRAEHFLIILLMNALFYAGKPTRNFILGFAVFAVFGMLYDLMRAFPNYRFSAVDIRGLYELEKELFGIGTETGRLTPGEFFSLNHSAAGDFLSGLFYINWMPVPLAFATWLYFTDRKSFLHFSLTFLFVNLLGFSIYYIHPAAPPWYVDLYGFQLIMNTPGNAAGLVRFDALIGLDLFQSIYTKNSNVFAALPSLHCAYPVVVVFYARQTRPKWLLYPMIVFMAGIWFAAVYSGHHYVIDALLGILCAIAGIFLYEKVLMKTQFYQRFTNAYLKMISQGSRFPSDGS